MNPFSFTPTSFSLREDAFITMKTTQNTDLNEIDPISNPNTLTILDRYCLASHWCHDKVVADYACGKGHGTGILKAIGAKRVIGFDFEEHTISENFQRYNLKNYNEDRIWFECNDITIPSTHYYDGFFDTVISIETFEHIPKGDVKQYLNNIKKMLKPDGVAIITTPIRRTKEFKYDGGTHLYEYTEDEFKKEISKVFKTFEIHSLAEFRVIENGLLHTELFNGIENNSKLFWCVITND